VGIGEGWDTAVGDEQSALQRSFVARGSMSKLTASDPPA
jgi:hypothetical protein